MSEQPETLFLISSLFTPVWYLKDSAGNILGKFNFADDAREWAKQNGYRLREL